jgi:hypothetical protein
MRKLSRSKIDLFVECPCCFYRDQMLNIKRPPGFPFSLNNAVDTLLKKEFDHYRKLGTSHPLQAPLGLIPADHLQIDEWREALHKGVQYYHPIHDCIYRGGIDDLWYNPERDEYHVVDYKATAKQEVVIELPEWADGYRRQSEIYQWLLRKNGLIVSDTAYFVYCTGDVHAGSFGGTLTFHQEVIPYNGNDNWVEGVLDQLQACLASDQIPTSSENCEYCKYKMA